MDTRDINCTFMYIARSLSLASFLSFLLFRESRKKISAVTNFFPIICQPRSFVNNTCKFSLYYNILIIYYNKFKDKKDMKCIIQSFLRVLDISQF